MRGILVYLLTTFVTMTTWASPTKTNFEVIRTHRIPVNSKDSADFRGMVELSPTEIIFKRGYPTTDHLDLMTYNETDGKWTPREIYRQKDFRQTLVDMRLIGNREIFMVQIDASVVIAKISADGTLTKQTIGGCPHVYKPNIQVLDNNNLFCPSNGTLFTRIDQNNNFIVVPLLSKTADSKVFPIDQDNFLVEEYKRMAGTRDGEEILSLKLVRFAPDRSIALVSNKLEQNGVLPGGWHEFLYDFSPVNADHIIAETHYTDVYGSPTGALNSKAYIYKLSGKDFVIEREIPTGFRVVRKIDPRFGRFFSTYQGSIYDNYFNIFKGLNYESSYYQGDLGLMYFPAYDSGIYALTTSNSLKKIQDGSVICDGDVTRYLSTSQFGLLYCDKEGIYTFRMEKDGSVSKTKLYEDNLQIIGAYQFRFLQTLDENRFAVQVQEPPNWDRVVDIWQVKINSNNPSK